ncbi:MAG: 8-amino-7-oxononanoate synthase [Breznakibacter sp.]
MYQQFIQEIEQIKQQGRFRQMRECNHLEPTLSEVDGVRMANFSSNDYLGLATDADLAVGFEEQWLGSAVGNPYGACSSRLLAGNNRLYVAVEHQLAHMYGRPALYFNSGYHANVGILPALAQKGDLVLSDKLVHASLIDGIRLCNADHVRFRHLDNGQLLQVLREKRHRYRHVFIVTESVFSMDGDVADLAKLVQIKQEFDAFLYVDEAHSVGLRGGLGLGLSEELGLLPQIDLLVGTMGKAWASVGAFVICNGIFRQMLVNKCRTLIFTTALPPVNLAWTLYVLQQNKSFASRRRKLADLSLACQRMLSLMEMASESQSHILPVMVGDSKAAVKLSEHLQQSGFFVMPVRPPTVPQGTSRLRLSLTANLSMDQLESLTAHINDGIRKFNINRK